MYGFIFKNIYSKELNIYVSKRPPIPKARMIVNYINIPGRSGSLTEDTGEYKDIELPLKCTIKDHDIEEKTIILNNWLDGFGILKLDYLTNFFFRVKEVQFEGTDIDYITGDFIVTFICDPFKYYIDNSVIEIKKSTIIYAPELIYKSEPILKIFGSGNITLNINNYSIKLKDVQEHITIDSTLQECYKDNLNCNRQMVGEFPLLEQENKIDWTGNVEKMEIIPNWRCL